MATLTDVAQFSKKWNVISSQAIAAGIDPHKVQAIYQMDLQRLQTPGSYAMSNLEAEQALASVGQNAPTIPAPSQGFSLAGLPGAAVSDAKDLGVGLLGLFKKGLDDLHHPTHLEHQVEAIWKDPNVLIKPLEALPQAAAELATLGPFRGQSGAVQTLADSPLLSAVVPGLSDLGTISKEGPVKGMETLAEHPIFSLLDVLPATRAVGKGAAIAAKAGLSEDAIQAAKDAIPAKVLDMSKPARDARAAFREAVPSTVRRAALYGENGLASSMVRTMLGVPFDGDTAGAYVARLLDKGTKGQLGPTTMLVGSDLSAVERKWHGGTGPEFKKLQDFVKRHAATSAELDALGFVAHHNEPDVFSQAWQDRWKYPMDPALIEKVKAMLPEFTQMTVDNLNRKLEDGKLQMVTDPRTGLPEPRATDGPDGAVVTAHKAWQKTEPPKDAALGKMSEILGQPVDSASAAHLAVIESVERDVLSKLAPWAKMDPAAMARFFTERTGAAVERAQAAAATALAKAQAFAERNIDPANPDPRMAVALTKLQDKAQKAAERAQAAQRRAGERRPLPLTASRRSKLARVQMLSRSLADQFSAEHGFNLRDVERTLQSLKTLLNDDYLRRNPRLESLRPALNHTLDVLKRWRSSDVHDSLTRNTETRQALVEAIDRNPSARYMPRVRELIREGFLKHVENTPLEPDQYEAVMADIGEGNWQGERFDEIVGKKAWTLITKSALDTLNREKEAGLDPVWVPSIRAHEAETIGRMPGVQLHIPTERGTKGRSLVAPNTLLDKPILGLAREASDYWNQRVMQELFYGEDGSGGMQARWGMSNNEMVDLSRQFVKEGKLTGEALNAARVRWREQNMRLIDPRGIMGLRRVRPAVGAVPEGAFYVPEEVAKALEQQLKSRQSADNGVARLYGKGTKLFRTSLLGYSPRYQAHIWLGGLAMLMMSVPEAIRFPAAGMGMMMYDQPGFSNFLSKTQTGKQVVEMLKRRATRVAPEATQGLPVGLTRTYAENTPDMLSEANFATGSKLGKWMHQALSSRGLAPGLVMAEFGGNFLRSMAYLSGRSKGGIEEGLNVARKVFADMDNLTPFERSLIRYAMPFYGWTRHVLRYAVELPLDHPYRVSILSNMINQEWTDWNSGIPKSMMYLFQIGGVDPSGNVKVLDIRQLDPLRSVTDVFTMSGFLSSLNPAFAPALAELGINPLTAESSDLYPTMTINDFYGTKEATRPSPVGAVGQGLGAYVPELSVVDHFLGLSSYTRWAKANNATDYNKQLYQALNFPWVPYDVNLTQTIAKSELNDYSIASAAATAALTNPDPNGSQWNDLIKNYAYVPYSGYLVQPRALRQWAFDAVYQQGYWNGTTATLPPNQVIIPPKAPRL